MIELLLLVIFISTLHILIMAGCAGIFGIGIREISIGFGRPLLNFGLLKIRLLPLGGFVRLVDSRDIEIKDYRIEEAFNHKSLFVQLAVILSGICILLLSSYAVLGSEALNSFSKGIAQVIDGALNPFGQAQIYLNKIVNVSIEGEVMYLLPLIATKFCALNMLPSANLNGGQALLTLLRLGKPKAEWQDKFQLFITFPVLLMMISWVIALVFFALN